MEAREGASVAEARAVSCFRMRSARDLVSEETEEGDETGEEGEEGERVLEEKAALGRERRGWAREERSAAVETRERAERRIGRICLFLRLGLFPTACLLTPGRRERVRGPRSRMRGVRGVGRKDGRSGEPSLGVRKRGTGEDWKREEEEKEGRRGR